MPDIIPFTNPSTKLRDRLKKWNSLASWEFEREIKKDLLYVEVVSGFVFPFETMFLDSIPETSLSILWIAGVQAAYLRAHRIMKFTLLPCLQDVKLMLFYFKSAILSSNESYSECSKPADKLTATTTQ